MPSERLEDVEAVADALDERAELEGIASGLRLNARRQITVWAIRWSFGMAFALLLAVAVDWLWWLPLAALAFAALSFGGIFVMRRMALGKIAEARQGLIEAAREDERKARRR